MVYDAGGRDTFEASLAMLATRGTLVLYGTATGDVPPFQLGRLSGLTTGSGVGSLTVSWVSASDFLRGADRGRAMRAVLAEVAAGRLTPRIHERFACGKPRRHTSYSPPERSPGSYCWRSSVLRRESDQDRGLCGCRSALFVRWLSEVPAAAGSA